MSAAGGQGECLDGAGFSCFGSVGVAAPPWRQKGCARPWQPGAGAWVSQPYLGPRGTRWCPGDMMTDWVSPRPAGGDAAASV